MNDVIVPRRFQQEFIDAAIERSRRHDKRPVIVADVHPGSGKTLAVLIAADELKRSGVIDKVAVFVPRLNLAAQFEHDWDNVRGKLGYKPVLKPIWHRNNDAPMFRRGSDGYVTTYSALCADPAVHLRAIDDRTLVVFDEAQQLGVDYDNSTTASATWAQQVGERARMVFVMSGTPYRADNSQLLFAEYDEPDGSGFCRLKHDVSATYLEGVRDGYLRPFETVLTGGVSVKRFINGDRKFNISDMTGELYRVLNNEKIWMPLVDRFIETVNEKKELIDNRLCGLIAAYNQEQARRIAGYIKRQYPRIRAIIAVSDDGNDAHKNLREFREGRADVLVTVNMAYVGYDYKPISIILPLTGVRTEGYLRQLFARGMRMMPDIDHDDQACFVIAPDDVRMNEFVEKLRRESDAGVLERELDRERRNRDSNNGGTQELGIDVDGWLTESHAKGIDPTGDLDPDEYELAESIRQKMRIATPVTKLAAFSREFQGGGVLRPVASNEPIKLTRQEQEQKSRSLLNKLASKCDHTLAGGVNSTTNTRLYAYFGKPRKKWSLEEIERAIHLVMRSLEEGEYVF